jgi:hypothetical protein
VRAFVFGFDFVVVLVGIGDVIFLGMVNLFDSVDGFLGATSISQNTLVELTSFWVGLHASTLHIINYIAAITLAC